MVYNNRKPHQSVLLSVRNSLDKNINVATSSDPRQAYNQLDIFYCNQDGCSAASAIHTPALNIVTNTSAKGNVVQQQHRAKADIAVYLLISQKAENKVSSLESLSVCSFYLSPITLTLTLTL